MPDISNITLPDGNTYNLIDATVPHTSETAASGGTALSLVTTGEKYIWNSSSALSGLSDVAITSLTNDEILQYNSTSGKWENKDAKADRVPLPTEYNPTSIYFMGNFCVYNGDIYQCTATTTTGTWDSSAWVLCNPQQDYLHSINPNGNGSFSLNRKSGTTIGAFSFAEGRWTTASGFSSHAEGDSTTASGQRSHAEGYNTIANESGTHAEGNSTTASGYASHAEGATTTASGQCSHVEGHQTTASEQFSHAEGYATTASGSASHAEGANTTASGYYSHAEGDGTTAEGKYSHSEGINTVANHKSQHVFGEYNVADTSTASADARGNYVEIVGNGTTNNARSNARTLDWSGNEVLAGNLKINSTQDVAAQVSLTQAEYDALVSAGTVDLVNTIYFITDASASACSATEVTYSNTTSGLTATNVQGAIDEVADDIPSNSDFSLAGLSDTTISSPSANQVLYYNGSKWTNIGLNSLMPTTITVTKGSSMPSGFPTPTVSRRGNVCLINFAIQIPVGTYSKDDALWTISPKPVSNNRCVVAFAADPNNFININVLSNGTISFNGNKTVSSDSWLIGQCMYLTDGVS